MLKAVLVRRCKAFKTGRQRQIHPRTMRLGSGGKPNPKCCLKPGSVEPKLVKRGNQKATRQKKECYNAPPKKVWKCMPCTTPSDALCLCPRLQRLAPPVSCVSLPDSQHQGPRDSAIPLPAPGRVSFTFAGNRPACRFIW